MAANSLGTLTLDLVARIGGFTAPLDQAERQARKRGKGIAGAADEASSAWANLGKIAGLAFAGLSVAGLFTRFIGETRAAESEQAQLAAVLASTGNAAGFSRDQLNSMADSLEDLGTVSAGEINKAQTALLAFTGIVGNEFVRAQAAALDMSERTGMSIVSAAETIGRALDVPSKGMAALSRQGFRFTEDQKVLIQSLEDTGRVAEAQGIILRALEETYGGAAAAARDTFDGALLGLQNTISGLLTGEGSLEAAKLAINAVNDALSSPAAAVAIEALTVSAIGLAAVLAARVAAGALSTAAAFAVAQREAVRYQMALASMAGVSTAAAARITAVGVAARASSAAMALLGGPVGLAMLAGSAILYLATSSSEAEKEAAALDERISKLAGSFDELGKYAKEKAIQDYGAKIAQVKSEIESAERRSVGLNRSLSSMPNSSMAESWRGRLLDVNLQIEEQRKELAGLIGDLDRLTKSGPGAAGAVGSIASAAYTEISEKLNEQILLHGKNTDAARLEARISAGLVSGLKEGEAEKLIALQKTRDAQLASEDAQKKREDSARRAAQAASDAAKAIRSTVDGFALQAVTAGMSARELALYKLEATGASEAQIRMADGLLREVELREEVAEAAAKAAEKEKETTADAQAVIDSLMTEEEAINASYERRREAILASTTHTAEQVSEALGRLEEERTEQLLEVNGNYWERWLAAAEDALTSFDDLAASSVENFSSRFGSAFESMVFDAESLDDAVAGMAEGMARSVVNALGQMAAQWLAYQVVQMLVGKTTQSGAMTAMVGNATAASFQAGINAFASTAAIPIVGPAMAPAAMAAALAATSPMVAGVASAAAAGLAGMAHEGIDSIPQTGTWLLEKGERVTTANTSAKLDRTLEAVQRDMSPANAGRGEINIPVQVTVQAQPGMSQQDAQRQGDQMARAFRDGVIDILRREQQQGGVLYGRK